MLNLQPLRLRQHHNVAPAPFDVMTTSQCCTCSLWGYDNITMLHLQPLRLRQHHNVAPAAFNVTTTSQCCTCSLWGYYNITMLHLQPLSLQQHHNVALAAFEVTTTWQCCTCSLWGYKALKIRRAHHTQVSVEYKTCHPYCILICQCIQHKSLNNFPHRYDIELQNIMHRSTKPSCKITASSKY